MWHWRKKIFQDLKGIAAEAGAFPEWDEYAGYCIEHERGLRKQAFARMEKFISRMQSAPFDERRRFVSWLMHRSDGYDASSVLTPYPLHTRVVTTTLSEWIQIEPESSEPHRWLGSYDHLKRAIALDPHDEIARKKFVCYIIADVEYNAHELPIGYLGDAQEDLADLDLAEGAISVLSSKDDRDRAAEEISSLRQQIQDYLEKGRNEPGAITDSE